MSGAAMKGVELARKLLTSNDVRDLPDFLESVGLEEAQNSLLRALQECSMNNSLDVAPHLLLQLLFLEELEPPTRVWAFDMKCRKLSVLKHDNAHSNETNMKTVNKFGRQQKASGCGMSGGLAAAVLRKDRRRSSWEGSASCNGR
jgi:hypothetical protein